MRPSFLDEYEELEKEYQKQYDIFVERYRNVDYLEHEAAVVCEKAEKNSTMHQTLLRLQKQKEDDELRLTCTQEDPQFQKGGREVQLESTARNSDFELRYGDQTSQNDNKLLSLESTRSKSINQPFNTIEVGNTRSESDNSSTDEILEIEEFTDVNSDKENEESFSGSELSSVNRNSDDDF